MTVLTLISPAASAVGSFAACCAIYACTIVFSAKHSAVRPAAVVALAAIGWRSIQSFSLLTDNVGPIQTMTAIGVIMWYGAAEGLLLSHVTSTDLTPSPSASLAQRLWDAAAFMFNLRRIGTKWQIDSVPRPIAGPDKRSWLLRGVPIAVGTYLVLDLMTSISSAEPGLDAFTAEKTRFFTRLGQVTAEQLAIRLITTVVFIFVAVSGVRMMYYAVAVFCVASGISAPSSWPPLFHGSVNDCYSVRRYWSTFYHQTLRRGISGLSDAFSDNVLRLPRGSLPSRYVRLTLAFALSGFAHHMGELTFAPEGHRGEFVFFTIQAFAIMFEDLVIWLYAKVGARLPKPVERTVGYIWTFLWLVWSVPGWSYPIFSADTEHFYLTGDLWRKVFHAVNKS